MIAGAPPDFVHVPDRDATRVHGSIRAARTDAQKADLAEQLGAALATRTGIDAAAVAVTTSDTEASWTMEGGRLLPEPGDEDDWKAAAR